MVSQFVSSHKVTLLGDLDFKFPVGIHAIGRLDNNSEGLLLLTTNKKVTRLLFNSRQPHERTYLVQLNNQVNAENIKRLQEGVSIRIKGNEIYITPPCKVFPVERPQQFYPRLADTENAYGAHCWLLITLTEGKFHQVRKMIGAIKHRCKRLIRVSIEHIDLGNLETGMVAELPEEEFFKKLNIVYP